MTKIKNTLNKIFYQDKFKVSHNLDATILTNNQTPTNFVEFLDEKVK